MIGIMAAMPEEIDTLIAEMAGTADSVARGMRTYYKGWLWGRPVVLVFSRWGKVSAATTATHLIAEFGVKQIIFTGVAGAIDTGLHPGDVVIAKELVQHDMDARPLFPRYEIPLLGITTFPADESLQRKAVTAVRDFLSQDVNRVLDENAKSQFHIMTPRLLVADIASGDKFFASRSDVAALRERLPVACVEMEGAAVAQVCYEHSIPLAVIRTVSDSADESAAIDFPAFIRQVAAVYSHGIIKRLLPQL